MRFHLPVTMFAAIALPLIAADSVPFDKSGNGLLKGAYNFRHVAWQVGTDMTGNLGKAVSIYGAITFDGNGNYSINGSAWDSRTPSIQPFTATGTYLISASGFGRLSSDLFSNGVGIDGLVSQGVFVGSSTEDGGGDIFIAAPASATLANTNFKDTYWVAEMNFPALDATQARDALFQLTPDGAGNLGSVSLTGYTGNGAKQTQSLPGSRYAFTNGTAALTFGGTASGASLINANQTMYMSPDGNLIFGGSNQGWDLFIGVRAGAGASSAFSGLYYQTGTDLDTSTVASGYTTLDTYYGAFNSAGGNILGHQRLISGFDVAAYDYTYSDTYALAADGTYDDYLGIHYILGAGGAIRVGFGQQGFLALHVALKAPNFSGPGVYLNPAGVLNGASSAPFTVGVSPGALITLYGTNLAPSTAADATFPSMLNGVQVLINNRPAPLYAVSATQVSVLVPWATSGSVAAIQLMNGGTASNTVTVFNNLTTPGIFTVPPGGIGSVAALHPDGSLITSANPAKAGEVIAVFLAGLGVVSPAIGDGAPGPANPLSKATNSLSAYVGTTQATIAYAGLAPQLRGLYQMNLTIPSGLTPGNKYLNISGPDSYSSIAYVSVGRGQAVAPGAEAQAESVAQPAREIGPRRGRPASRVPSAEPRVLIP